MMLRFMDDAEGSVREAATVLRRGGLVAFPTETVYGLGAIASDERAVGRVFEAKGRPSGVPLIVHVTDIGMAARYVAELTDKARALAERFWPGPLTLVLHRAPSVPLAVTGGGETVAVRAPAHEAALALISGLGEGIAAPSANRYNALPPVRAAHVAAGLGQAVDCVLDGGRCPGGIESTVVDLTATPARIIRRGAVSWEELARVVAVQDAPHAPAPRTVEGEWLSVVDASRLGSWGDIEGDTGVVLRTCRTPSGEARGRVRVMPVDEAGYASELYEVLHDLREARCAKVLVEALPAEPSWDAMRDRLARLAASLRGR